MLNSASMRHHRPEIVMQQLMRVIMSPSSENSSGDGDYWNVSGIVVMQ